ncbi:rod shape-determining protein MreD [Subsaxibacter sp. CAU 1640]|nr:rod shape-determining protein MreD [Subsaxibacter sp. CAU 1640]MCK7590137.1 rod shape-determining protein MreD [Subsaxibacter sp. CAU 1640]
MNSVTINSLLRFVSLVLLQGLVLNHVNFLSYINPYPYILFVALFPINNNRTLFIFLAFLLGLSVDFFTDSGGIHAAACVTIAYIRPPILKFSFGTIYDNQTIKFSQIDVGSRMVYFSILTLFHHLILFSLEVFNISDIILILKKTLFSSIFTIILCTLFSILFSPKRK